MIRSILVLFRLMFNMNRLTTSLITTALLTIGTPLLAADMIPSGSVDDLHLNNIITFEPSSNNVIIDLAWDNQYISQGRNNLDEGGIYWATAAWQQHDITLYGTVGRADSMTYIEWNLGLEYALPLGDRFDGSLGYQRIQVYGDEECTDNELFASLSYTNIGWLTPSIAYTYSTEAAGYFVEANLHSEWALSPQLTITPYVTQGFDFQYATEAHNGRNHLQLGVEIQYQFSPQLTLSGHISHTLAQQDIKREVGPNNGDLDHTFAGLHLNRSL